MKVKSLMFVPLTKVDEVERTVTGQVTAEVLDKAGEIFHYETSVPYFKAWSEGFEAVTKGKSKGNVRSMHQAVAVGKLIDIQFDDDGKQITATAKIVDDAEWEKVQEGVYTGFSIGGKYVKQWKEEVDGVEKTFFTADPIEVSIVDNPCVPSATFTAVKADGAEVEVEFKLYEPTNEEVAAKAEELAEGKEGKTWTDFIEEAKKALIAEHGIPEDHEIEDAGEADDDANKAATGDEPEVDDDAARDLVKQVWTTTDGGTFDKKADAVDHQKTIDNPVAAALAKANKVLKDGAPADPFPVDTHINIRASWVRAHKVDFETEEERQEVIAKVKEAWEKEIGTEPPSSERLAAFLSQKAVEAVAEVLPVDDAELKKGNMYGIREWAYAIDQVLWAANWCGDYELDDEPLYAEIKSICIALLTFMLDYVDHEITEMIAGFDKKADAVEGGLAKVILGVAMQKAEKLEEAPIEKSAYDQLQKDLKAANDRGDRLEKQVSEAVTGIEALTKTVAELKDQPEPRRHPNGKTVEKSVDRDGSKPNDTPADANATLQKLIEEHGPEAVSQMLIKAAQANPRTMLNT